MFIVVGPRVTKQDAGEHIVDSVFYNFCFYKLGVFLRKNSTLGSCGEGRGT